MALENLSLENLYPSNFHSLVGFIKDLELAGRYFQTLTAYNSQTNLLLFDFHHFPTDSPQSPVSSL